MFLTQNKLKDKKMNMLGTAIFSILIIVSYFVGLTQPGPMIGSISNGLLSLFGILFISLFGIKKKI